MQAELINKLVINEHVYISKLKNGVKYILLKGKDNLIPLFMKNGVIDIVSYIKEYEPTEEALFKRYGHESKKILNILKKYKIVADEDNRFDEIDYNFSYEDQINKLNSLAYETRTPLSAKMEITYNCNYKCKYCFVKNVKYHMMPFEDAKTIMKKLKDNGVNELYITGGEPFLHPDILKIIDISQKLDFITTIQTNASLLNEDIIKKLKEYKCITLGISFHSCYKEKFDEFTQTSGAYFMTLNAVKLLKKYNVPFFLKMPITIENENDIEENIKFFKENDYKFNIYCQILPDIKDDVDNSKYSINKEHIKWLYENGYLKFQKTSCAALRTKMWISSKGDVYPCELTRNNLGNLADKDFDSIWFSEKAEAVLKSNIYIEPKQCVNCEKKIYCNKCLAYLNYENWKQGLKYFCDKAEIIKNLKCF